jgi:uncharacterized protein (TIGR02145 family)
MKKRNTNPFLIPFFLLFLFPFFLFSQSPSAIPYQAVVRNNTGYLLTNTPVTVIFKIHSNVINGPVTYEENHNTTTNSQGLIDLNLGSGTPSVGIFNDINWEDENQFLHIIVNSGDGPIDLGTQQLLSVPYSLYSKDISTRISANGDSLIVGNKFVIVPGISAANPQNVSFTGPGSVVLPDNSLCTAQTIAVTGCYGETSLNYNNVNYALVEIGGQCWFQENLSSTKYRDGSDIPTVGTNSDWTALTTPAYCWYNNSPTSTYGALYNWFAVNTGNLCPTGWHVASDCDWMYLENAQGLLTTDQIASGWRGASAAVGSNFRNADWSAPNIGANNSSAFTALPGGYRMANSPGNFTAASNFGFWWTSSNNNTNTAWSRGLAYNELGINRDIIMKKTGMSVRCVKD